MPQKTNSRPSAAYNLWPNKYADFSTQQHAIVFMTLQVVLQLLIYSLVSVPVKA